MPRRTRTHRSPRSQSGPEEKEYRRLRELASKAQDNNARDYYNLQARDYIFRVHNINCAKDEIDLHGLHVKEAKDTLLNRIIADMAEGRREIHVIVGVGSHSRGGVPKIGPAVEELCHELGLQVLPQNNPGRVHISLPPSGNQARRSEVRIPPQTASNPQTSVQPQQPIAFGGSSSYAPSGYGTPNAVPVGYVEEPQHFTTPVQQTPLWPPTTPLQDIYSQDSEDESVYSSDFEDDSADVPTSSLIILGICVIVGITLTRQIVRSFF